MIMDYICPGCRLPAVIDRKGGVVHAPPHCSVFTEKTEEEFLAAAQELYDQEAMFGKPARSTKTPGTKTTAIQVEYEKA